MKSSPYVESFTRSAKYKAHKLLELSKVCKIRDGEYKIFPIYGYNHTTYIVKELMGKWTCGCQQGRKNGHCSHILAVHLLIERTEGIKERQTHFC